jgi:N-acetylmuramic acid 6-phosphate etherase
MENFTEKESNHGDLEKKSTLALLEGINREDQTVPLAVKESIPQIERLTEAILRKMQEGGRLFYIGAGTSGRLGVVDASECPPTYGVPHGLVIGLIAGGDVAIRKSVEHAEDDPIQGWKDLEEHEFGPADCLIGIAASGRTPYVIGAVKKARAAGAVTGCITCNASSPLAEAAEFPVEIIVGPEFVTGSTRMKSGTAQKLALNMISTTVMIRLGRVRGNRMVDMQLSNSKLKNRGLQMVMEATGLDANAAQKLLDIHGSVRKAIDHA